jgi:hypothetical protein
VVVGLHDALEGEVVDGAHGDAHGWSVKKILMNATLSGDVDEEVVEALHRRHRTMRYTWH